MFCNKDGGTLSVLLVIERFRHRFNSHLIKAKQGLQWLLWSIGLTMGIFLHTMSACHPDLQIGNLYIRGCNTDVTDQVRVIVVCTCTATRTVNGCLTVICWVRL